jgi:hypothetical protein
MVPVAHVALIHEARAISTLDLFSAIVTISSLRDCSPAAALAPAATHLVSISAPNARRSIPPLAATA